MHSKVKAINKCNPQDKYFEIAEEEGYLKVLFEIAEICKFYESVLNWQHLIVATFNVGNIFRNCGQSLTINRKSYINKQNVIKIISSYRSLKLMPLANDRIICIIKYACIHNIYQEHKKISKSRKCRFIYEATEH